MLIKDLIIAMKLAKNDILSCSMANLIQLKLKALMTHSKLRTHVRLYCGLLMKQVPKAVRMGSEENTVPHLLGHRDIDPGSY